MGDAQLDQVLALQELMNRQEELDPDLEPYLEEDGPLGRMVRHPLVYAVPLLSNALANEQLRAKREMLREARVARNWNRYVHLYEKPYRIEAFSTICYQMGDAKYWELLGGIWTGSENIYQNEELWRQCLAAERRYRSHVMNPEERKALAHDIDKTIYRGFHHPGREHGLSWTTNSIVAKFFARRLAQEGDTPMLATGRVDRKDIIAFFDGRSEYEIVVLPENVREITVEEVGRDGPARE